MVNPLSTPFTDEVQIWYARVDPCTVTVYAHMPNFVSTGIFYRSLAVKKFFYHFVDFGILWCRQLTAIWESWTRVHNYEQFRYPTASKRLWTPTTSWRNREHKLRRSEATNRQTYKHTNKILNVFGRPGGGWSLSPSKFGIVVEDLEHVLAASKQSGLRHILLPLGALKIWGNPTSST